MTRRIRWAVRGTLFLGVAASITANVLHARDNPISQAIAAWPPLALLITVEVVARVPITRRWFAVVRVLATALIAGIAAWVSYWHMAGVAQRYGEQGSAPFLLPLSVDGLIVVASVCLVELGGRDRAAEESTRGGSNGTQLGQGRPQGERGDHVSGGEGVGGAGEADGQQGGRPAGGDPAPVGGGAAPPVAEVNLSRPRKPHTTNPDRVRRAYDRNPEADPAAVAKRLNLSLATVKKYRPPKEQPEKVNGKVPELDLEGAKA
jgi:hypothetical protein